MPVFLCNVLQRHTAAVCCHTVRLQKTFHPCSQPSRPFPAWRSCTCQGCVYLKIGRLFLQCSSTQSSHGYIHFGGSTYRSTAFPWTCMDLPSTASRTWCTSTYVTTTSSRTPHSSYPRLSRASSNCSTLNARATTSGQMQVLQFRPPCSSL